MTLNVTIAEAKRKFPELVSKVQRRRDSVVIAIKGKPAAALVNVEDLIALYRKLAPEPGHILECVGLFADIPEWEQTMKEVVASRSRSRPRKVRIP